MFLVGFANKGSDDFIVETIQASFRYQMYFNYFFHNFSALGHPLGLNIALIYRDASGKQFSEAVFNESFSIIVVFLAAIVVLLLVLGRSSAIRMASASDRWWCARPSNRKH
ncbi:translocon-associated protein subunit alpha [Culex quinquefasciatus]|uniref:translocon-associated protein subunit alpha n=1 Tax=Culex quinquefasciatus TaxID=7176 RepID=UPI0018E3C4F0|nr:translocon-associated protein subunit alpha [Culex quinquefasciatus]